MYHISAVTIQNNEGLALDLPKHYIITMKTSNRLIQYQDLARPSNNAFGIHIDGFKEILESFILELVPALDGQANIMQASSDLDDYEQWRRTVLFDDTDVTWHIKVEFQEGPVATFVNTKGTPVPAVVDQFEATIKEVLGIH